MLAAFYGRAGCIQTLLQAGVNKLVSPSSPARPLAALEARSAPLGANEREQAPHAVDSVDRALSHEPRVRTAGAAMGCREPVARMLAWPRFGPVPSPPVLNHWADRSNRSRAALRIVRPRTKMGRPRCTWQSLAATLRAALLPGFGPAMHWSLAQRPWSPLRPPAREGAPTGCAFCATTRAQLRRDLFAGASSCWLRLPRWARAYTAVS